MPWNGAGDYSPPVASFPEVNGTLIDAARFNATVNDLADGISAAVAKNGENVPTANLPMGNFKHTGAGAANAAGQYGVYGQASMVFGSGLEASTAGETVFKVRATDASIARLHLQNSVTGSALSDGFAVTLGADGITGNLWNYENGPLLLGTNNIERVRIVAAGEVGIGKTPTAGFKLDVAGSVRVNEADFISQHAVGGEARFGYNAYTATSAFNLFTAGAVPLVLGAQTQPRMYVLSGAVGTNDIVIGGTASDNTAANRTCLQLTGGINGALLAFRSTAGHQAYLYADSGTGLSLINLLNSTLTLGTSAASRFVIAGDGRIYGTALHNNGDVTGTVNHYFASGTYTPTLTNTANIPSASVHKATWVRVGRTVTVGILLASGTLTAGANTITRLGVSLPIPTNFTTTVQSPGSVTLGNAGWSSPALESDAANDRLEVFFVAASTTTAYINLTAVYEIN